jgi:uncharacterized protein
MIVDLRRLDEEIESRGRLASEPTVPYRDAFDNEINIRCRVELTYERSGGAYFFHGHVEGDFQTQCHYCLSKVPASVAGDFDVVVKKSGGKKTEGETDPDSEGPEDLITLGLNEYEVSFDKHISENLIVNIPMQILCSDDCKGLCPQCGVNRNHESCKCGETTDPRWDALRKLKNE